jgi:16S rRNA (uracil1498-N3)-methyltransferase
MSRFYVEPDSVKGDRIYVGKKEAHHILDVMRLKKGDGVTAFDGTAREYSGVIEDDAKRGLIIKIESVRELKRERNYRLVLAQALPKANKMEVIIQKATELGVDSVIPLDTKRAVVRLNENISSRRKRWEKIAREASKQCGRARVTDIGGYLDFDRLMGKVKSFDLALMPSTASVQKEGLKGALKGFSGGSILIVIGPEGGFDPTEINKARGAGVRLVSLGENVFRCDTAAISVIAMINYALS